MPAKNTYASNHSTNANKSKVSLPYMKKQAKSYRTGNGRYKLNKKLCFNHKINLRLLYISEQAYRPYEAKCQNCGEKHGFYEAHDA